MPASCLPRAEPIAQEAVFDLGFRADIEQLLSSDVGPEGQSAFFVRQGLSDNKR